MNTTFVYIELIVIGLEGMMLMLSVIFLNFGLEPITNILNYDYNIHNFLIVIAFAYVLGIILDKLSDIFVDKIDSSFKKKHIGKDSAFRIYTQHNQQEFHSYIRTRIRIVRSSMLYLPLAGSMISAGIQKYNITTHSDIPLSVFIFGTSLIMALILIRVYIALIDSYYYRAKQIKKYAIK